MTARSDAIQTIGALCPFLEEVYLGPVAVRNAKAEQGLSVLQRNWIAL